MSKANEPPPVWSARRACGSGPARAATDPGVASPVNRARARAGEDGLPARVSQAVRALGSTGRAITAALLLGGLTLVVRAAWSQEPARTCPAAADVVQAHMVGLWRAEFEGLTRGATLLLEKHPEYEGSLSGGINRDGVRGVLAGDIEKGELTLEESADGKRISGTFLGTVVEGSCGREIRGTWQDEEDSPPRSFLLRKR